jgi:hypothetical protein
MSLSAVRTRIRDKVAAVPGIGPVYDYMRHAVEERRRAELFRADDGRLHFWCVTPAPSETYVTKRHPANHEIADYRFDIHGFMALRDADATELLLSDLAEAVIAAFRADKKLGDSVIEAGPAQWVEHDHRMFADVLCHHVRLSLMAREQVEP